MDTEYRHLNREALYQWARKLTEEKGSPEQQELLDSVRKNNHESFVGLVESAIANINGNAYQSQGSVPSLLDAAGRPVVAMTEGHMYLMPAKDTVTLFEHWQRIPYAEAACPSLWGAITLAEIREQRIKPAWLAVGRTCRQEDALSEIDEALKQDDPKKIDFLVRRVIRWLSGPGAFRGAPELYGNCSLAKAWWCGCLAQECAKKLDKDVRAMAEALQSIWLGLAEYLSGKLTVVAEPNITSGIALWSHERLNADGASRIQRKNTEQLIQKLGEVTSWCALGLAPPQFVCKIIQEFDKTIGDRQPDG